LDSNNPIKQSPFICVTAETNPDASYFTSRNGHPEIAAIEAFLRTDGETVCISVYNRKKIELHAGGVIAVEAMDELRRRGLGLSLDIVGPIAERHKEELTEMLHRRGLEGVTLHGYMKPLRAWQLAKRSVAGLAILSPAPNYIESFPTKMFEYMALGLPVVVSNFPLYKAVVDSSECGICVDPQDPSALADAIELLVMDRPYASRLGANGRSAIQITAGPAPECQPRPMARHRWR